MGGGRYIDITMPSVWQVHPGLGKSGVINPLRVVVARPKTANLVREPDGVSATFERDNMGAARCRLRRK